MDDAIRLSGERTKAALREYVRLRRKKMLLELPGKVRLEENWEELREAELGE